MLGQIITGTGLALHSPTPGIKSPGYVDLGAPLRQASGFRLEGVTLGVSSIGLESEVQVWLVA